MNKTLIYWIIGILTAGPIFLILFQDRLIFSEDQINNLTKIIPAFFSAGALLVALSLYDKHGLKKMIFERKLKVVLDLVEEIKSFPIVFYIDDPITLLPHIDTKFVSLDMQSYKETNKHILEFTISSKHGYFVYELEKFRKYQNNPYLPKEVSDLLNFLNFDTEYLKSIRGMIHIESKNYSDDYLNANTKPNNNLTYGNFLNGFQEILREINKWLEANAGLKNQIRL